MLLEVPPACEVEEVTTKAGLERLAPEWAALWRRCNYATPFQSPAWLIPWTRHLAERELIALALRREGRMVGLAPLYIYKQPESGRREVFLLGIGTSDFLDVLFEPGYEEESAATVLEYLGRMGHRWDRCDFQQLRPGSPLLEAALPRGWTDDVMPHESCPALHLPRRGEDLSVSVPVRLLKNLRYYRRRAERQGTVHLESANAKNLEELWEGLLRLHAARWAERDLPGVLADDVVRQAHEEALPRLLGLGALRMYGLRLDGRLVACLYVLADAQVRGGRHYYYLSGFDPDYERLSPGTLILGHAIEEAAAEGAASFEFLRGREEYKYHWGARDRPTFRRVLRYGSAE